MLRLVFEAVALSPVDVPRRVTLVRAQWKSQAVTELEVPRSDRRTRKQTPKSAIEQIRQAVRDGASDEEIATSLNRDGITTGASKLWNAWAVRWARGRAKITRMIHDCPRDVPLPERHPDDGYYSLRAAAKRFGVTPAVVHRWIRQGLLQGRRESFGAHPHAWWLSIDETTAARLDALVHHCTGL